MKMKRCLSRLLAFALFCFSLTAPSLGAYAQSLWLGNDGTASFGVLHVNTSGTTTLGLTPNLAATGIASDGTVLLVSDSAGNITKVNLVTGAVLGSPTLVACNDCRDMAFDGQFLWRLTRSNRLQKIDPATLTLIGQEISLDMPIDRLEAIQWSGNGLTWDGTRLIGSFCQNTCTSSSFFMEINRANGDVTQLFIKDFVALGLGFDEKTGTYWVGGADGNVYNLSNAGQVLSSFVVADQRDMDGFELVDPISDLSLAKSDSPDPVGLNQNLTYTLTVKNNGPDTATNVVVTDTLPSEVTFVSAVPNGCNNNNGTVTCNLGSLNKDATATVTIVVTAIAKATITNNAHVTSDASDPNPDDNSATATTSVQELETSDLSIAKTDSPDPVGVGQALTYTLTVTNAGPDTATGIVVTDTLPANVTFVSASTGCLNSSNTVTCTIANNLGKDQSTNVSIVVTSATADTITNTASVQSTSVDPTSSNNTATASTVVRPSSDLGLTKSDSPDPVGVGQQLTYTLTVTNNGPNTANNAVITDTLPANVTFVSASSGCSNVSNTITCTVSSIAANQSVTVNIVVTPTVAGTLTNSATVLSDSFDSNSANNTATASTVVKLVSDLALSKTASSDAVTVGKRLTYTLTVTNHGPDAASGVVVTDTLPSDVEFVSVAPSSCTVSGSTVTCSLSGSLAKNGNSVITIVVKPLTEGTTTNTATVTSNSLDPTSANNSASVDTTVRLASCDRSDLLGAVCALRFSVSNLELLFNYVSHGLYETLIAINNGRNLISQNRAGSLIEASLELAIEEIESIAVMFDEPRSLIDNIHEQIGAALGEVQALFESPDLSPALAASLTKIKLKLETVELTLAQIANEWDLLQDKLDDGEAGEDPIDDISEALHAAQEAFASDDIDGTRLNLNRAQQLTRNALRELRRLSRKDKVNFMRLVSAEAILNHSDLLSLLESSERNFTAHPTEKPSITMLERSDGKFVVNALGSGVRALQVQIYAMNGRLIADQIVPGMSLSFMGVNSEGAALANGVYLVRISTFDANKIESFSEVRKLVIVR